MRRVSRALACQQRAEERVKWLSRLGLLVVVLMIVMGFAYAAGLVK